MDVDRVLLAAPRGFCAGVEMAIKALAWMVRAFEPPVYCYHEIVHNQLVVDRFQRARRGVRRRHRRGAAGAPAHALGPRIGARGRGRGPGPRRLRRRRRVPARHQGPPRGARCGPARATRSSTSATRATRRRSAPWPSRPAPSTASSRVADVAALPDVRRARRAARPDHADAPRLGRRARRHRDRFPELWMPGRSDLCFATTNRQSALMAIAPRVRRDRRHRLGELVEHRRAREAGARGRLRRASTASTEPTSCPTTSRARSA